MKENGSDRAEDGGIAVVGEPRERSRIVVRTPGAQVVSLAEARKTASGPPWELVESHLQGGKSEGRIHDWQHRSPAFASALRVLDSLEWPAGEPRANATRSTKRAPSCLLRPPPGRRSAD